MYLDVLPITRSGETFSLAPEGDDAAAVEYALRMRQFPQEALLSERLGRGLIGGPEAEALAGVVAGCHAAAPRGPEIMAFGEPARVRATIERNYAQTERYVGSHLTRQQFDEIRRFTDRFFVENDALLRSRAAGGFVRDCHGDLHLGNVCFHDGRYLLFDCIEFSPAYRCVDVMYDVGFAAMDFRARGRPDLATAFCNAYAEATGDWDGLRVLPLYLCRQAYVRGKVNSIRAEDPGVDPAGQREAALAASDYYRLAREYTRPRQGRLVLMSGLSGSGKTTIARGSHRCSARPTSAPTPSASTWPASPSTSAAGRRSTPRK